MMHQVLQFNLYYIFYFVIVKPGSPYEYRSFQLSGTRPLKLGTILHF